MNFVWNYTPPSEDRIRAAKELAEKIGMSPILADLLIQRGIKTESAAKRFFRPMLSELISPVLIVNYDKVRRLATPERPGERVAAGEDTVLEYAV